MPSGTKIEGIEEEGEGLFGEVVGVIGVKNNPGYIVDVGIVLALFDVLEADGVEMIDVVMVEVVWVEIGRDGLVDDIGTVAEG